jgi:hypothetical protein
VESRSVTHTSRRSDSSRSGSCRLLSICSQNVGNLRHPEPPALGIMCTIGVSRIGAPGRGATMQSLRESGTRRPRRRELVVQNLIRFLVVVFALAWLTLATPSLAATTSVAYVGLDNIAWDRGY